MTLLDSDPRHDHGPPRAPRSGVARFVASPVGVVVAAVAAVFALDAAGTDDGPGLCLFRRCTGGYCPGCGMTRSARHLTRGQFGAAWSDHPWLVLLAVQVVVAGAVYGVVRWIGTQVEWRRVVTPLAVINVVLLIGIWVARLVDGSIPRFF
ncbi:DUF2752 domain-containing protein [Ilumatobacter nonamiensis]|uniref:DUF2752 domain-containing protein n=1 Tax=Ilumatobacter nonamiensis TaxID=467093 RepID=UPI00034C85F8|nr:DUF2752 domain-containing protein [Ilumatobacter nonamiensis]